MSDLQDKLSAVAHLLEASASTIRDLTESLKESEQRACGWSILDYDPTTKENVLGLRARAQNVLYGMGITTIDKLTRTTAKQIMAERNSGKGTVDEIRVKLAKHGLSLTTDTEGPKP